MRIANKISQSEFEAILPSLENKPYLIVIAGVRGSQGLLKSDNIKPLSDFNQSEMLKEICQIYILDDWKKFKATYKGFMYPFTIKSFKDLDESLFERNRVIKID